MDFGDLKDYVIEITSHFFPLTYRYRWQIFEHRFGNECLWGGGGGGNKFGKLGELFGNTHVNMMRTTLGTREQPPPKKKTRPLMRRECTYAEPSHWLHG
jgi:hypothetical protein